MRTARDLGATQVGLVSPYLAYMRQDRRFRPGEALTSVYVAELLSSACDWLVTVDPHLHRRDSLSEIYSVPNRVLHAAPAIGAWIKSNVSDPLLIGPDSESEQWISQIARACGAPSIVLSKVRRGDRDVSITVPDDEMFRGKTCVLADDIISTARTMIETVRHLKARNVCTIICIGVHPIFAGRAYDELMDAGATRIVSCDTIPHPSNGIDLTDVLARGIRDAMAATGQELEPDAE